MNRALRTIWAAAPLAALALLAGCSGGPAAGTVSGEVTLDGQPLKQGLIRFVPADGKTATADGPIADGKYSVAVPAGEKKVEISAAKVVGRHKMYDTPDSPVVEDSVELLPARYNVRSELTYTVTKGPQEKKFDLTSK
jgi:hypothetical protein